MPEMWGGLECTINRRQDIFKDQLHLLQHYNRIGDVEAFARLGIKALRYPVLWEKHCNLKDEKINWSWTSKQLALIRQLNIKPVAGLLHHGSGPAFTSLVDENFPRLLADYAREVATQFPWIEYYTPVNEPLTTARFSGLYGYWYPHLKTAHDFLIILLNQLEGTVLSMKAIREVNPFAKLVQTEDLGHTHSTRVLKYQADFENHRRWLTYDLLCGKVDQQHPLYNYFIENGIADERLEFFTKNTCVPDLAGFNYYVTSERYLDHRIERFDPCVWGSNGRHRYADTEAARAVKQTGLRKLLTKAWNRYHIPIAITEAHLHCTRDEQLRWFKEVWDDCCYLTKKGIPIKAVTAWSLLGAYDWDSLLVRDEDNYQIGVYDVSHNKVRPTAMVKLIQSLSKNGDYEHPILNNNGWWYRHNPRIDSSVKNKRVTNNRPLLIIGKSGTLGNAFKIICEHRGIDFIILSRQDIDITNPENIVRALELYKPWCVINSAGYVQVDNAERDVNRCFAVNALAPGLLASECQKHDIPFMTFSTDMVFNGDKRSPYIETDKTAPLNMYGKSKLEGEASVLNANPTALIIRTSAFFGPWDRYNFAYNVMESLDKHNYCDAVKDVLISPTYVPDLVNASLDLLIDDAAGIWHLSNMGSISWADFAEEIAQRSGHSKNKIILKTAEEMDWKAKRPPYSVLESEKGITLPFLSNAIDRYFSEKAV